MKRLLGVAAVAGLVLATGATGAAADSEPAGESTPVTQATAYSVPSIAAVTTVYQAAVYDATLGTYVGPRRGFTVGGSCTGYAVNPEGYIATAGHCVDPGEVIDSVAYQAATWAGNTLFYDNSYYTPEDILSSQNYQVVGLDGNELEPAYVEVNWPADFSGADVGRTERAEVVDFEPLEDGDAALLRVNADDLVPLPLSDGEDVEQGIDVFAIGYPGSVDEVTTPTLNPSVKEGSISSIKTSTTGFDDVYEISAAVSGGMSGGPVVNMDSEVIGFNSYGNSGETQAFNFSGPSTAILDMMAANNIENELGPTGQAWRAGLDAYFAGERGPAVSSFEAVLADNDENAFAEEYLEKAQELPAPDTAADAESSGGFPVLWVAVGAGGLLLAGLVLFLATRRGGSSNSAVRPSTGPAVPGVAAWPPAQQPYQQPHQPAPPAYPPAPQMPVPASPPQAAPEPGFDPNKTTYVGQREQGPQLPQQQGPANQYPGQQPPRQ
jgi:S1-C subfamily serine protease